MSNISQQALKQALTRLSNKDADLFEVLEARNALRQASPKQLERVFAHEQGTEQRVEILSALREVAAEQATSKLIRLACEDIHATELRLHATRMLSEMPEGTLSWSQVRRLLGVIEQLSEQQLEDMSLPRALFLAFTQHRASAAPHEAEEMLQSIAFRGPSHTRIPALLLLGFFGEVDTIERMCLVPVDLEQEREALKHAVEAIINRPINISRISPETFERLMAHLLTVMGYQRVATTPRGRDGGVDLTAVTAGGEKLIGQCKRYDPHRTQVPLDALREFARIMLEQEPVHGLFLTTSRLSKEAKLWLERKCRPEIRSRLSVVETAQLQGWLDTYLGIGRYRIESSLERRSDQYVLDWARQSC